jgi:hypothetical protein
MYIQSVNNYKYENLCKVEVELKGQNNDQFSNLKIWGRYVQECNIYVELV